MKAINEQYEPNGTTLPIIEQQQLLDDIDREKKRISFSSTLQEADYILNGDRQADYADPKENFERIARIVSIATNKDITPSDIATVMITIKLLRENNKHKRDNCVDGAAYFEIMNRVNEGKEKDNDDI